jgi:Putative auto-transporter adhesin, head GIN domain
MKKQFFIPVLCAILSLSLTSCIKESIDGNGNLITEKRTISAKFTAIRLQSTANVVLKQGSPVSVEVTSSSNILSAITTNVVGNTLVIDTEGSIITNAATEVTITVPNLAEIIASSTGDISTEGNFIFNDLIVAVSGTGDIKLAGTCKNMTVKSTGLGDIEAFDMPADMVVATLSSMGNLKTTVKNILNVTISGSGDVFYKGNPTLLTRITGSGDIKKY